MNFAARFAPLSSALVLTAAPLLAQTSPSASVSGVVTGANPPAAGTTLNSHSLEPLAWGATNDTIFTEMAWEFAGDTTSVTTSYGPEELMRYITGGGFELVGGVHLPTGSLIDGIALSFCNDNVTLPIEVDLYECADPSGGCTALITLDTPVNFGCGTSTLNPGSPPVIVNSCCTYSLGVFLPSEDSTQRFRSVKIFYRLQVSPDPAFATFADVPVGHPQHRFVEALYAAGITAGCGGGNFCPDNPLTRGQMAVFLSVALGLNWPN